MRGYYIYLCTNIAFANPENIHTFIRHSFFNYADLLFFLQSRCTRTRFISLIKLFNIILFSFYDNALTNDLNLITINDFFIVKRKYKYLLCYYHVIFYYILKLCSFILNTRKKVKICLFNKLSAEILNQ